ncbi:MAG TPA: TylF/MycF/NovP-related O-methyltransferase [Phycisphaerae bacterium]|nr:TylF/MycF/NovP-related O-methyltransferase [Phycisphaerae bacterium]
MSWKGIIQRCVRALGYEITRRGTPETYTLCPPYGYFTYAPWFEEWFQEKYRRIQDHTCVKEDRCYSLYRFCQHCARLPGDLAECGVFRGGTALLLASTLRESGETDKQIHLFDTFEGMPKSADGDASSHRQGDFGNTSLDHVKSLLRDYPNITFNPGFIPHTLGVVKDRRFAMVHIDLDLYQSTRDAFEFFYSRVVPGGIMVCDDYGAPAYIRAAKLAVDEFFADKPENPISLRNGQCFVIKAPASNGELPQDRAGREI